MNQTNVVRPLAEQSSLAVPQHLDFIDALRGYAILGVVAMHVGAATPKLLSVIEQFTLLGATGVQLFFVISAFTLFWSLQSRSRADRRPTLAFFARRFFRIAPLFWVGIAFYFAFPDEWRASAAPNGVGWPHLISTIFFVHGWYPTTINTIVPGGWSIAAEVMFYLCVPFLFSRVRTLSDAICLLAGATLFAMVYFLIGLVVLDSLCPPSWDSLPETFLIFSFPSQFPVFCMGLMLYFLIKSRYEPVAPRAKAEWSRVAIAILFAGVLLAFRMVPKQVLSAAAFGLIAWAMSLRAFPWGTNSVIRFIGKVSYSAYIWHFWVLHHIGVLVIKHMNVSPDATLNSSAVYFVMLAVVLVVTLAISTVSFYVIEQPAQRLGSRLIKRMGWGEAPAARDRIATIARVDHSFAAVAAG